MDVHDIQLVVQWQASCNVLIFWQHMSCGACDSLEVTVLLLIEAKHFCWNNSQSRLLHRQELGLGVSTNSMKRFVHPGPRDERRRAQTREHTGDAANSRHATGGAAVATWGGDTHQFAFE